MVGIVTASLITGIRTLHLNRWLILIPIVLVPGLGVPLWLSYLLKLPYLPLAASLCIGQVIPAVCGVLLVKALGQITAGRHANVHKA